MKQSHPEDIAEALRSYRAVVLQKNTTALRIIIEELEAQNPPEVPSELAQATRMRLLADHYLCGDILDLSSTPEGLLRQEIREELIERFTLDGVVAANGDSNRQEQYFADLQRAITDNCRPFSGRRSPTDVSPDLITLCSYARQVLGSGLPNTRDTQQVALLSDLRRHPPESRVLVPAAAEEGVDGVWHDWEVSVAIKIGDAAVSWGGSFAIFCRSIHQEREEHWAWRYGLHDEDSDGELFATLAGFMDWHARLQAVSEEELRLTVLPLGESM